MPCGRGTRRAAKDILTRLLKADQNNSTYWIWMSAAVDTTKERIYCLETALKLDPANAIAKRGLVLLGGLPPDENVQPFPLNRPRAWEQDLLLAHEKPRETGAASGVGEPRHPPGRRGIGRLAGLWAGGLWFRQSAGQAVLSPGPGGNGGPIADLHSHAHVRECHRRCGCHAAAGRRLWRCCWAFPTRRRRSTSIRRARRFRRTSLSSAKAAYEQGNWDEYIRQMQQIQKVEPQAADVPYYIGEGYRLKGDCRTALISYNDSLQDRYRIRAGLSGPGARPHLHRPGREHHRTL